ncbi:hypothetical protein ACFSJY_11905 [Thalassotalea euphylliae]|uniref:DUF7919 family protein n=1 Tax=Thalassotalea euphylliae TaxID=1655234 RepID=UPI0036341D09
MYCEDLSNYNYFFPDISGKVKNVGWIVEDQPFSQGIVSDEFKTKLLQLFFGSSSFCSDTNLIRGPSHPCNLCGECFKVELNGKTKSLGSSEIWVPSEKERGIVYASPSLLIHYIEVHGYCPPAEYIEAVMSIDLNTDFNGQDVSYKMLLGR